MTDDKIKEFIANSQWIFAKTYATKSPHEYTLLKSTEDEETFKEFARHIDENAIKEKFKNSWYKILYIGDFKYWHMDGKWQRCDLINRTHINPQEFYSEQIKQYS